ncbi:MAG: hypothetical protein OEY91_11150, partial [Nitrospirota bacterium]|nr:hypothetical protein [Nitrospirota bacterium]
NEPFLILAWVVGPTDWRKVALCFTVKFKFITYNILDFFSSGFYWIDHGKICDRIALAEMVQNVFRWPVAIRLLEKMLNLLRQIVVSMFDLMA